MKVVAINGSARKNGNTVTLIKAVFAALKDKGIETEMISLAGLKVRPCRACFRCAEKQNRRCAVKDDDANDVIAKLEEADGIILGSPVYFADVSAQLKCLIERAGMTAKANGAMFARKPAAAVVAVRRAGAVHTFDSINHFFLIGQMIVVGSSYWNVGYGREPGAVKQDEEGMGIMKNLGKNMAWLLKRIEAKKEG